MANIAAHTAITGVAEFAYQRYAGVLTDRSKAAKMEETELFSKRSITQTVADKFAGDFIFAESTSDKSSKKDKKIMLSYVGSDIIKPVGAGMRQCSITSKTLQSDFEPSKKTKKDGLAEMSARVEIYTKLCSELASLEANFTICLTYLSMMQEVAQSLEHETFATLEIGGYTHGGKSKSCRPLLCSPFPLVTLMKSMCWGCHIFVPARAR